MKKRRSGDHDKQSLKSTHSCREAVFCAEHGFAACRALARFMVLAVTGTGLA
jgi:hypothetical protein